MSVVERRERTETWVEQVVPVGPYGAAAGDVKDAFLFAAKDYERMYGSPPKADDTLRVFITDDEIIVRFQGPSR